MCNNIGYEDLRGNSKPRAKPDQNPGVKHLEHFLSTLSNSEWARDEPDNAGQPDCNRGENCLFLNTEGTWSDNSCSSTYRMVLACEKLSYDGKLASNNQGDGPKLLQLNLQNGIRL